MHKKSCQHENGKCSQCGQPMAERERRTCRLDRVRAKAVAPTIAYAAKGQRVRLGDTTEVFLQAIGVTKERYIAAKELFGLAPTCNCDARKAWLNKVSDWWQGNS